jgi:hypothetical protein
MMVWPRFDDTVPVETIVVDNPELAGIPADQLTFIDEKVTCRVAQRPGSYVVLRYVRSVTFRSKLRLILSSLKWVSTRVSGSCLATGLVR